MIQAERLGHVTIETPDLHKSMEYFVSVNGLVVADQSMDSTYLTSKFGQLTVHLQQSGRADCSRLSFEVSPDSDFGAMARFLNSEGIENVRRSDPFPGTSEALTFNDPNGIEIDLFKSWEFLTENQNVSGVGPLKVGHAAFYSPRLEETVSFYERILGFRVSDWIGDFFVFMRCNPDHHTVNFFRSNNAKLHHLAFELKDFAHIQQSCETLSMHQIPIGWGPIRHGAPGHNIAAYHRNPDDHAIEYYCELDQMKNEALGYFEPRPWHTDRPQRPRTWDPKNFTTGWGLPPSAGYLRPVP